MIDDTVYSFPFEKCKAKRGEGRQLSLIMSVPCLVKLVCREL